MKLNGGTSLPDTLKIAGNEIKVVLEESLPDNNYGYFSDATNTIHLSKTIKNDYDGKIILTDSQVRNTYYHELMHAFQFYYNNRYDEAQAQVYANFICEMLDSIEEPF